MADEAYAPAPAIPQRPAPGAGSHPRRFWLWLAAVVASVLAFAAGYGLLTWRGVPSKQVERLPTAAVQEPARAPEAPTATTLETFQPREEAGGAASPLAPDSLFARCSPAVVQVEVWADREGRAVTDGSGFLVGGKDLVATNYHVIRKAYSAHVVLADKTELPVVGVAAADEEADVAIIKLDGRIRARPLELAGDDLPPVGAKAYAIGSPLGLFANTLSDGLVSAHRERGTVPYFPRMPMMIQTTAPISHGSSGGPLLNADGKVVGITTLGFAQLGGENLNLAVPAAHVRRLLLRYASEGRMTRLPLALPPAVGRPQLPEPAEVWPPEDVENAAHFVRAWRAAQASLSLCQAAGHPGQPWLLGNGDLAEFCALMERANREAKLVRDDVLKRMHPGLPDAFYYFMVSTSHMKKATDLRDSGVRGVWERWAVWCRRNGPDIRVPKGALR